MVTGLRSGGLAVRIDKDDHRPAHGHVVSGSRQSGEAKIDLGGVDGPRLVWARGTSRTELRRAFALVAENRDALLEDLRSIHGD